MKILNFSSMFSNAKEKGILFSAQMSLTNRCNEDCIHCLVCKNIAFELSTGKIKDIITELKKLNCMEIIFTGGEAMLRNDFFEIMDFTKRSGIGARILSNGTLINEGNIAELKRISPLNVQISLYGATCRTHDFTTRLKGSFEMTTNALRLLKKKNIPFSIATIVMRHNIREIPKMSKMAQKERCNINFDFVIRPRNDGFKGPLSNRVTDYQIRRINGIKPAQFFTRKGYLKRRTKQDLCVNSIGRSHLFISSEGKVFPNVALRINCGSLKQKKLKDIWLSSKELNYLRSLKLEDFECSKCKYMLNCSWDPGLSLAEHKSLFKKPQELCRFMENITGSAIQT